MIRREGFTLIELMIVVVVIGILLTIAVPNFLRMKDNAFEAQVKSSTHTVQLVMEDFAVRHDGVYTDAAADLVPLLPGGNMLENAFTNVATEPQFAAAPATSGQIGVWCVAGANGTNTGYRIEGMGRNEVVLALRNGD